MHKQFFRFLKEAGAYGFWYENRRKWFNSTKFRGLFGKENKFFPPMYYFGYAPQFYLVNYFCSFPWGDTPEGLTFWEKIHRMWVDSISNKNNSAKLKNNEIY